MERGARGRTLDACRTLNDDKHFWLYRIAAGGTDNIEGHVCNRYLGCSDRDRNLSVLGFVDAAHAILIIPKRIHPRLFAPGVGLGVKGATERLEGKRRVPASSTVGGRKGARDRTAVVRASHARVTNDA